MDPAVWYEETRRRAEMIDSPDCTFTPIAPAPVRRKVTDIFIPVITKETDQGLRDTGGSEKNIETRIEEENDHAESVLLLDEASDYVSQHQNNGRESKIGSLPVNVQV